MVIKLARDNAAKLQAVAAIFKKQIDSGLIERVSYSGKSGCHYVPNLTVEKPDSKTTPLRVVMDWATKTRDGVSLNDCLETGEPLQNNIVEILINFGIWKIGIVFDIEKAFHKIQLHKEDFTSRFYPLSLGLRSNRPKFKIRYFPLNSRSVRCKAISLHSQLRAASESQQVSVLGSGGHPPLHLCRQFEFRSCQQSRVTTVF